MRWLDHLLAIAAALFVGAAALTVVLLVNGQLGVVLGILAACLSLLGVLALAAALRALIRR